LALYYGHEVVGLTLFWARLFAPLRGPVRAPGP